MGLKLWVPQRPAVIDVDNSWLHSVLRRSTQLIAAAHSESPQFTIARIKGPTGALEPVRAYTLSKPSDWLRLAVTTRAQPGTNEVMLVRIGPNEIIVDKSGLYAIPRADYETQAHKNPNANYTYSKLLQDSTSQHKLHVVGGISYNHLLSGLYTGLPSGKWHINQIAGGVAFALCEPARNLATILLNFMMCDLQLKTNAGWTDLSNSMMRGGAKKQVSPDRLGGIPGTPLYNWETKKFEDWILSCTHRAAPNDPLSSATPKLPVDPQVIPLLLPQVETALIAETQQLLARNLAQNAPQTRPDEEEGKKPKMQGRGV